MEENRNYTYTYQKKENKPKHTAEILIAVFAVVMFSAAAVIGAHVGKKKAAENVSERISQQESASVSENAAAAEPEYKPGLYTVNTGGYSLLFRKEPRKDSEADIEIPDKKEIEIKEIYYDEAAQDENYRYWGKLDYLGYTGWVAMRYLAKAYSDGVVTPEDLSKAAEESSRAAAAVAGAYEPGEYVVHTPDSTLRLKDAPSAVANVLANLPDGTVITVSEITEVSSDDPVYRHWGKTTYNGTEGYVSMYFLDVYDDVN